MPDSPLTAWWQEFEWTLDSQGPLGTQAGSSPPAELRDPPDVPRYQNLRRLGGGAMGEVWLVRDRELQREVALKLGVSRDAETAGQFALEAQITSQLDHPNIPPVYDVGLDLLQRPYMTSKLIRGHQPLTALIERLVLHDLKAEHDFGYAHRVQIVLQAAGALAYAHSRCVVHQDIKPENIVLGDYGEVYLLDWGVASIGLQCSTPNPIRVGGSGAVVAGARGEWVLGTPLYMSPEQVDGQPPDDRSDVYSLCAVLYELLALRHYLAGVAGLDELETLAVAIRSHAPPSPCELYEAEQGPPRELCELCLKGLRKDPDDRFQSADELREALQEWLDGVSG